MRLFDWLPGNSALTFMRPWLLLFLLAIWLAFLVNSSFDVFLEGPMGAAWFWTIFGTGAAAAWLYRRHPQVLYRT